MYHQSLSRQPEDPFCTDLLNRAFEEAMSVKLTVSDSLRSPMRSPRLTQTPRLRTPNDGESLWSGGQRSDPRDMSHNGDDDINFSFVSGDVDMSMHS